ncbi:DUF2789 domain-containing protein [Uliginosibacterium sp. sgz301328]|uniref:DUF2789 domain-containing protein n=1 Tax=Uliginosibacterium sp. sgz301328 TaxID=3243764 RepID=UPI00359E6830
MEAPQHSLNNLFAQLGLPTDNASIDAFIASHRPLPDSIALHEAACWTPAQSALLREEILLDADWAEVVDQLNVRLRG